MSINYAIIQCHCDDISTLHKTESTRPVQNIISAGNDRRHLTIDSWFGALPRLILLSYVARGMNL